MVLCNFNVLMLSVPLSYLSDNYSENKIPPLQSIRISTPDPSNFLSAIFKALHFLDITCAWKHTCRVLHLASFIKCNDFEVHPCYDVYQ